MSVRPTDQRPTDQYNVARLANMMNNVKVTPLGVTNNDSTHTVDCIHYTPMFRNAKVSLQTSMDLSGKIRDLVSDVHLELERTINDDKELLKTSKPGVETPKLMYRLVKVMEVVHEEMPELGGPHHPYSDYLRACAVWKVVEWRQRNVDEAIKKKYGMNLKGRKEEADDKYTQCMEVVESLVRELFMVKLKQEDRDLYQMLFNMVTQNHVSFVNDMLTEVLIDS